MSVEQRRQRVVLVGLGATTSSALEGLSDTFDVVLLVRDVHDDTTRQASALGVPVVHDVSVVGVSAAIRDAAPDAVVVSSYNRILSGDLLSNCPFINVHYAPLPRGRGRATVNWAMINGDDRAWISIHHLVAELDAGGVLYQGSVPINPSSTVAALYDQLNEIQRQHLAAAVTAAIAGEPGRLQNEEAATYYCARVPADGEIDWSRTSAEIDRLVRALQPPFPEAFTWLGLDRLGVDAAEPVESPPVYEGRVPGRVVEIDRSGGSVSVLTGDGVLRLHLVRLGDGDQVDAATVITSVRTTLGLRAVDLVASLRDAQRRITALGG